MATNVLVFDKENKQDDYQYMAKDMKGKWIIGYIVIDKPWYSNEKDWTYYIVDNEYGAGGFCGGVSDLGLRKRIVDRNTIEAYTQIAQIKYNQSIEMDTELVRKHNFLGEMNEEDNIVAYIKYTDEIPYELWDG